MSDRLPLNILFYIFAFLIFWDVLNPVVVSKVWWKNKYRHYLLLQVLVDTILIILQLILF